MMDRKEKKSLPDEAENKKFCADCKTTKTPLWRSGPAGPKSLCNACGIRFRKKRRAIVGLEKSNRVKKKERSNSITTTTTSSADTTSNSTVGGGNGLSESLKKKLMVLGKEMMLQRSSIAKKQRCQRRRKLGEEEQAAFSLMAMSCGSVLACKNHHISSVRVARTT